MSSSLNKISTLVENQLPRFIREDHPIFVEFLQKYYEFLEQPGNPVYELKKFEDNYDIDATRESLLRYFKNKILPSFPEKTEMTTERILKASRDFYAKKGTPDSFKFLFRVLYDQDIDVFFPKLQIMKASDGKWMQPQVFRLSLTPISLKNVHFINNGLIRCDILEATSKNIEVGNAIEISGENNSEAFIKGYDDPGPTTYYVTSIRKADPYIYFTISETIDGERVQTKLDLTERFDMSYSKYNGFRPPYIQSVTAFNGQTAPLNRRYKINQAGGDDNAVIRTSFKIPEIKLNTDYEFNCYFRYNGNEDLLGTIEIPTTAINVDTNTLTLLSHGLVTGVQKKYYNNGGTSITGLVDGTTYYVIKIDENTIKLATDAINADAGNAIDLNGVGNSRQYLTNINTHTNNAKGDLGDGVFKLSTYRTSEKTSTTLNLTGSTGDQTKLVLYVNDPADLAIDVGDYVYGNYIQPNTVVTGIIKSSTPSINTSPPTTPSYVVLNLPTTNTLLTEDVNIKFYKGKIDAITFSSSNVDLIASTITIPNHGFVTGQPKKYYLPAGISSTILPISNLLNNTTYYVIVVSSNKIKLATTPANADAGIAINFKILQTTIPITKVSPALDTITWQNHGFPLNTPVAVKYMSNGGTAIGGLTNNYPYYAIAIDSNRIKLTSEIGASGHTGVSNKFTTSIDPPSRTVTGSFNNNIAYDSKTISTVSKIWISSYNVDNQNVAEYLQQSTAAAFKSLPVINISCSTLSATFSTSSTQTFYAGARIYNIYGTYIGTVAANSTGTTHTLTAKASQFYSGNVKQVLGPLGTLTITKSDSGTNIFNVMGPAKMGSPSWINSYQQFDVQYVSGTLPSNSSVVSTVYTPNATNGSTTDAQSYIDLTSAGNDKQYFMSNAGYTSQYLSGYENYGLGVGTAQGTYYGNDSKYVEKIQYLENGWYKLTYPFKFTSSTQYNSTLTFGFNLGKNSGTVKSIPYTSVYLDTGGSYPLLENRITIANHGLVTGQAITYFSNGEGQLDPLVDGTVYYVYRNDANTIQLCETYEAATNKVPNVLPPVDAPEVIALTSQGNSNQYFNVSGYIGETFDIYGMRLSSSDVEAFDIKNDGLTFRNLSKTFSDMDYNKLEKKKGIGSLSKASCVVESVIRTIDKGTNKEILEVYVSSVNRFFQNGEFLEIEYVDDNDQTQLFAEKIIGAISNIKIDPRHRGKKYKTGDPVVLNGGLDLSSDTRAKAVAVVNNVTTGSIETVSVVNGGYGFRTYANSIIDIISDTGIGANVIISEVNTDGTNLIVADYNKDSILYKKNARLSNLSQSLTIGSSTATASFTAQYPSTKLFSLNTSEDFPIYTAFRGYISGRTLTVVSFDTGSQTILEAGMILYGPDLPQGTYIVAAETAVNGGTGTYSISTNENYLKQFSGYLTHNIMNVTSTPYYVNTTSSAEILAGDYLTGGIIPTGTTILQKLTGSSTATGSSWELSDPISYYVTFNGYVNGTNLYITTTPVIHNLDGTVATGNYAEYGFYIFGAIAGPTLIPFDTYIVSQSSGTSGDIGTYVISKSFVMGSSGSTFQITAAKRYHLEDSGPLDRDTPQIPNYIYAQHEMSYSEWDFNGNLLANLEVPLQSIFEYDALNFGKIESVQVVNGGSNFLEVPTLDAISLYEHDYSEEEGIGEVGLILIPKNRYNYYPQEGTVELYEIIPAGQTYTNHPHFSNENGFYVGWRIWLRTSTTASHFRTITKYEVTTDPLTLAVTKKITLSRNFEFNVNQINIQRFDLYLDPRPNVSWMGRIAKIDILNAGKLYSSGDTVRITGTGYGASATISVNGAGAITAVNLVSRGEGYPIAPEIHVDSAAGTGASLVAYLMGEGDELNATADKIGQIKDFKIISRGSDYITTPKLSLKIYDICVDALQLGDEEIILENYLVYQGESYETATFKATIDSTFKIVVDDQEKFIIRVFNYSGIPSVDNTLYVQNLEDVVTAETTIKKLEEKVRNEYGELLYTKTYPWKYGDGRARANVQFLNGLIKYNGYYLNTDGHVSSDRKLQDSIKYHNFSYAISSDKLYTDYRKTVADIVHPAGAKLTPIVNKSYGEIVGENITINVDRLITQMDDRVRTCNVGFNTTLVDGGFNDDELFTQVAEAGDMININSGREDRNINFIKTITSVVDDNNLYIESPCIIPGLGRANVTPGNKEVDINYTDTSISAITTTTPLIEEPHYAYNSPNPNTTAYYLKARIDNGTPGTGGNILTLLSEPPKKADGTVDFGIGMAICVVGGYYNGTVYPYPMLSSDAVSSSLNWGTFGDMSTVGNVDNSGVFNPVIITKQLTATSGINSQWEVDRTTLLNAHTTASYPLISAVPVDIIDNNLTIFRPAGDPYISATTGRYTTTQNGTYERLTWNSDGWTEDDDLLNVATRNYYPLTTAISNPYDSSLVRTVKIQNGVVTILNPVNNTYGPYTLVINDLCKIVSSTGGTNDFTSIGSAANTVGTEFIYNAAAINSTNFPGTVTLNVAARLIMRDIKYNNYYKMQFISWRAFNTTNPLYATPYAYYRRKINPNYINITDRIKMNVGSYFAIANLTTGSGNTSSQININTDNFIASTIDDYYTGMQLKVLNQTTGTNTATIINYNGTTKIATLNAVLSVAPSATSNISISSNGQFVKSIVSITGMDKLVLNTAAGIHTSNSALYYEIIPSLNVVSYEIIKTGYTAD